MDRVPDLRPSRRDTLIAYGRLPHAVPIVAVMATTVAMAFVLAPDLAAPDLIALSLAMLGAQLVIGVVNELNDEADDRAARRDKPLVTGLVSRRGAIVMLAFGLVLITASAFLGITSIVLCALGCAVGVAYSLWFKRTRFAWLPYLAALPLLPIWVAVSLGDFVWNLLWLYPLGVFAVIAVQFAQAAPDIERDRAARIASVTTALGERGTLLASWGALVGSAVLVGGLTWPDRVTAMAATVVFVAVAIDAVVYGVAPTGATRALFPLAAASVAVLGVAWVYANRS